MERLCFREALHTYLRTRAFGSAHGSERAHPAGLRARACRRVNSSVRNKEVSIVCIWRLFQNLYVCICVTSLSTFVYVCVCDVFSDFRICVYDGYLNTTARVLSVVYPDSKMAYDSPYVVLCQILALLQTFVTSAKSEYDAWLKIDDSVKGKLTHSHTADLEAFIERYTKLVNDAIESINKLTAPPRVIAVAVYRFNMLLNCIGKGLKTDILELLQSRIIRYALMSQLDFLHTRMTGVRGKLRMLKSAAMREYIKHQEKYLAFCMGTHPRLGKEAYLIHRLAPELMANFATTKYDVCIPSLVRALNNKL